MKYILSKFSHELRNPLTTVYSTIQLIELQHPEVKDFKYWTNLAYDLEYMNQLIDEFSNYSKAERLNLTTFSLRELLEHVSLSFAATIVDSGVQYRSKIDSSINQITGDKTKLQEVFLNLLKNAFDATAPNKSICLEAISEDTSVTIRVRDTGCGIPKEQLPTVFEPFVTYKKDGTGLGLAICKQIVAAHRGTITVESVLNAGTTFSVNLPIKR